MKKELVWERFWKMTQILVMNNDHDQLVIFLYPSFSTTNLVKNPLFRDWKTQLIEIYSA